MQIYKLFVDVYFFHRFAVKNGCH